MPAAEVVVQRRGVALTGSLDDLFQRCLERAELGEQPAAGVEEQLAGRRGVARHGGSEPLQDGAGGERATAAHRDERDLAV